MSRARAIKVNKADEFIAKMKPIRKATLESIRKETSKYIFVEKDGNAYCEKCHAEFTLLGSKHKGSGKCPECNSSLEIWHTSRKSELHQYAYSWRVIAEAIDNTTLALRYVLCSREGRKVVELDERAVMVLDFETKKISKFENPFGQGWKKSTKNFFQETFMYNYRKICCLGAEIHNKKWFSREVSKVDLFKYFDPSKYMSGYYASSVICHCSKKADLFEKLEKVGLGNIINQDLATWDYRHEIEYIKGEKELHKMLGISKATLKICMQNPTVKIDTLKALRKYPDMSTEYAEALVQGRITDDEYEMAIKTKNAKKSLAYIKTNGINYGEYEHYLSMLTKLEYPEDSYYLYPKNFREADAKISAEYSAKENTIQNKQIKAISDALRKMDDLQKYLNGSKGFFVYVPESSADLTKEGKALHNCIGTYTNKIAEGKTLVFYIRQLDNPLAPFVAMEYKNGKIVQVRYDHNKSVETNSNVYQSAKHLHRLLLRTTF